MPAVTQNRVFGELIELMPPTWSSAWSILSDEKSGNLSVLRSGTMQKHFTSFGVSLPQQRGTLATINVARRSVRAG